jgi:hypothetical protein
MASFTNQIDSLSPGALLYPDVITQGLSDGLEDVIMRIIASRPGLQELVSAEGSIGNDYGVALDFAFPIVDASRDGIRCVVGTASKAFKYVDPSSLYYATVTSPVVYIKGDRAYIIPSPTAVEKGAVNKVVKGTIEDNDGTISNFPKDYYRPVVLFAAARCCLAMIDSLQASLPSAIGEVSDIVEQLPEFLSGVDYNLSADLDILKTYVDTEEDIELAASKAAEITVQLQLLRGEVADSTALQGSELSVFNANIQKSIGLLNVNIQREMAEIGLLKERHSILLSEYVSIFGGGAK